jgi:hypothetical protein
MRVPVYCAFSTPFAAWWVIGVLFESLCVRVFFELNWSRAFKAVIAANIISTVVGIVVLSIIGEPIVGGPIGNILGNALRSYERTTQLFAGLAIEQVLLAGMYTAIQLPILVGFGARRELRSALIIFAANLFSVGLLVWIPPLSQYYAVQY